MSESNDLSSTFGNGFSPQAKIYVAGHRGMVGSAILRRLKQEDCKRLICRTSVELDLCKQQEVDAFFSSERPEYVFLAAARVGGIYANQHYPADFIRNNLQIQTNVIDAAYRYGVKKLLFLGSSCIYPRHAPRPIREEHLLTGKLEPTNEWYAIAKIAGIKMCQAYRRQYGCNFISAMPTNLFGINDHFDLQNSHVLPALIRKFHEAKLAHASEVVVWGSGAPRREFMYVDDLADAAVFLMRCYEGEQHINVGAGKDISIRELAELVKDIVGFNGNIVQDTSRPDGMPLKLMDSSRLHALGWKAKTGIRQGIEQTYRWYREQPGTS